MKRNELGRSVSIWGSVTCVEGNTEMENADCRLGTWEERETGEKPHTPLSQPRTDMVLSQLVPVVVLLV